jgi:parallel beta-helix repeat protein
MITYGGNKRGRVLRIAIGFMMMGLLLAGGAGAATLTVCPGGCAYSSIQGAINAASIGDTVQVKSGTYYENVNVNKQQTLRGIGMPVVDAGGSGSAITLAADGIVLEGFTATGADYSSGKAGIEVTSNNNKLIGNNASNNNGYGIYLGSMKSYSNNNTLSRNNANYNNRSGISLNDTGNNMLSGNNASSNYYYGIFLLSSSNNTLTGNNAYSNNVGINLYSSSNNKIYHNILINNTNQAQDFNNTNSWDSGYPSRGNYWGDYTGSDIKSGPGQDQPASDGIGDTPYNIGGGGGAQDRYPFMNLNGWNLPVKGDLNGNGVPTDAGDLVLMKRASIGEIQADSRYDLNNNGQFADAGDLVLMKRASIGEIILN